MQICRDCFQKCLFEHLKKKTAYLHDQGEIHLKCPFCYDASTKEFRGTLRTEAMFQLFAGHLLETVRNALEREFLLANYATAFCPVPNCQYVEFFAKSARSASYWRDEGEWKRMQSLNCPQHGKRCIRCWKPVDGAHECAGVPDEFLSDAARRSSGLARCPECFSAVEKNGGCDHITCRCGHQFNWEKAVEDLSSAIRRRKAISSAARVMATGVSSPSLSPSPSHSLSASQSPSHSRSQSPASPRSASPPLSSSRSSSSSSSSVDSLIAPPALLPRPVICCLKHGEICALVTKKKKKRQSKKAKHRREKKKKETKPKKRNLRRKA